MPTRKRSQPHTFEEQISAEKARCEEQLAETPDDGPERAALVEKIRKLETAIHMSDWLRSSGPKSPGERRVSIEGVPECFRSRECQLHKLLVLKQCGSL